MIGTSHLIFSKIELIKNLHSWEMSEETITVIKPDTLRLIWKHYLGEGKTTISKNIEDQVWAGAGGWSTFIIQKDDSLFRFKVVGSSFKKDGMHQMEI